MENQDINKLTPYDLMTSAVGTEIKILSNDYEEYPLPEASPNPNAPTASMRRTFSV